MNGHGKRAATRDDLICRIGKAPRLRYALVIMLAMASSEALGQVLCGDRLEDFLTECVSECEQPACQAMCQLLYNTRKKECDSDKASASCETVCESLYKECASTIDDNRRCRELRSTCLADSC